MTWTTQLPGFPEVGTAASPPACRAGAAGTLGAADACRAETAGTLGAAEAERAEYGWMLPSTRARARLLKPGTMVVSQPSVPVPLVVTFPFPPWATRKEEVADEASGDPFAGL